MRKSAKASFCQFLFLLALTSCSHAPTVLKQDLSKLDQRPAIIFIPGFYGSALRDADSKRTVFLTLREYLFGNRSLALHNDDLKTPKAANLEVEGVLGAISVVPGIYQLDIYGKFVADLEKAGGADGRQVIPFAYDWRDDLQVSARKLSDLVDEIRARGCTRIDLVSHSMGGLITAYYLAYGAQSLKDAQLNWRGARLVSTATFMGTPFDGVFSIFRNMQRGALLGSNHTLLPADAVASFPSSYMLMSPRAKILSDGDPNDERMLDLFNPKLWEELKLGLLASDEEASVSKARKQYVAEELARGRKFHELVDVSIDKKDEPPQALRILNVAGKGVRTLKTGLINRGKKLLIFDTDLDDQGSEGKRIANRYLFTDGDGTVSVDSSKLPSILQSRGESIMTKASHLEMLSDSVVRAHLFKLLGLSAPSS